MRIISHRKLKEFYESSGQNDSKVALERWYQTAIELALMSDIVESYEKKHYPIGKPTVSELIESFLEEKNMSQKQFSA